MGKLYDELLPLVQALSDYGGNFTAFHISRPVLEAIDIGATTDASLTALRTKLLVALATWKGLQDHKSFSVLFEAYYEAVFYLVAMARGVRLRIVSAGTEKGKKTPDFETEGRPVIGFEVKTIDVADPLRTYDGAMYEGLEAKIETEALASQYGIGMVARTIEPHGNTQHRREVAEQVMKKIESNVKAGQYKVKPTFLVVSAVRSALHQRTKDLRKNVPWPGQECEASGQLFAIAAHTLGDPFYFFNESSYEIENLGPLDRAGILRDHPYIAGMLFLYTDWNLTDKTNAIADAFKLNGIWNTGWRSDASDATAKAVFEELCNAWNDTENTRSALLPTQ